MTRLPRAVALCALAWAVPANAAPAHEQRCGWLVNETPANFELIDKEGTWTLGEQGGYQAPGIDEMPDMSTKGVVETNGPHGHSCACLTVSTNRKAMRVTRIYAARPVSLQRCRLDHRLSKP